jgi:hypothetical protein
MSMKRLVFVVEGDTEIRLVEKLIMPYLHSKGITNTVNCVTITTNRKQHKKGGVPSYGKFKNEVERHLAQRDVIVTSLVDYYKLPTDFPAYTTDSHQIGRIEKAVSDDIQHPAFMPYIQRHEVEALMFCVRDGFEFVIDDEAKIRQLDGIMKQYPNPEDINNSPHTAPSKRLEKVFGYDKANNAADILEMVGIESMLEKCPRFKAWIDSLVERMIKENLSK